MKTPKSIAHRITESTGLYTSPRTIRCIAAALLEEKDFWKIVDRADEVVPVVSAVLEVFLDFGWLMVAETEIQLTETGRQTFTDHWKIRLPPRFTCSTCEGRGVNPANLPSSVREKFMNIHEARPKAVLEFDQGYVTPSSTLARCAFAHARGDLDGKDVLILGDDDLAALAIALMARPRRIVVVEIDKRLIDFIRDNVQQIDFPVEVYEHDLSQPLSESFLGSFDTFLCDPPESFEGFRAFVGRGLSCLHSPGGVGYFGFTRREATLMKWYRIQKYLNEQGAVITDILHNFHVYENWDYTQETRAWRLAPVKSIPDHPWYRSALYRVETLFERSGEPDSHFNPESFNDDEASTT